MDGFYCTFTSATGLHRNGILHDNLTPLVVSRFMNPRVKDLMTSSPRKCPDAGGIVPMDFIQPDLVAAVFNRNAS